MGYRFLTLRLGFIVFAMSVCASVCGMSPSHAIFTELALRSIQYISRDVRVFVCVCLSPRCFFLCSGMETSGQEGIP